MLLLILLQRSILQNITTDVNYVEELMHIWESLMSVEYVLESMQEKDWLWVSRKLVGNYLFILQLLYYEYC